MPMVISKAEPSSQVKEKKDEFEYSNKRISEGDIKQQSLSSIHLKPNTNTLDSMNIESSTYLHHMDDKSQTNTPQLILSVDEDARFPWESSGHVSNIPNNIADSSYDSNTSSLISTNSSFSSSSTLFSGNDQNNLSQNTFNPDINEVSITSDSDPQSQDQILASSLSSLVPIQPDIHRLQSIEPEIISEGVYKWIIPWSRLLKYTKTSSPVFDIGSHKWRILFQSRIETSNREREEFFALFLDSVDSHNALNESSWNCCAQFSLSMVNPLNEDLRHTKEAHHRFTPTDPDWGFTQFIKKTTVTRYFPPSNSSPAMESLVHNDTLTVIAHIRIVNDITGNLWHTFVNYDSRKETGYVGLKNQGATCYMNSLLQSLFFINYFRKAVFQISTDNDDTRQSIPFALQKLFYQLLTCPFPPSTNELTKSFGWDTYESFLQRDVQEFSRKLQESLETKMKGTQVEGILDKIFMGTTLRFVRCINVPFESSRTESFYDIPLSVKGMKGVHESFQEFVTPEVLEGDNRYRAEEFGLQEAKIGVIFQKFPPVLHLQLKRFEYDMIRDMVVKVNDRYEFPTVLNLGEFMEENAPDRNEQIFHLYGILVHSGDVGGGHYYAFMKDPKTGKWLKFDDDHVVFVLEREAIQDNFGGDYENSYSGPITRSMSATETKRQALKRFTNAYMLVYIREKDIDEMLCPLAENDIPKHLIEHCESERREEEERRVQKQRQHLYMNVRIATDDLIRANHDSDLIEPLLDEDDEKSTLALVHMRKDQTIRDLKQIIEEEHRIPLDNQRFWLFKSRYNTSLRPSKPIIGDDELIEMRDLLDISNTSGELCLYLEIGLPEYPLVSLTSDSILLFIKYYDSIRSRLDIIGHIIANVNKSISSIVPDICELAGVDNSLPIILYEETRNYSIQHIGSLIKTSYELALHHGTILVFQVDPRFDREPVHVDLPTIPSYYEFMSNKVTVQFRPRPLAFDKENRSEFCIELSKTMKYDQMSSRVANHLSNSSKDEDLEYLSKRLRFTGFDPILSGPKRSPFKHDPTLTCSDMLPKTYYMTTMDIIYYEILRVPLADIENKKMFVVFYPTLIGKEFANEMIYVDYEATGLDVFKALAEIGALTLNCTNGIPIVDRLCLLEVSSHRIVREYESMDHIMSIGEYSQVYLHISTEQEYQNERQRKGFFIRVFQYHKDVRNAFGIPFKLFIDNQEIFSKTKQTLAARLGLSEREIAKCKFAAIKTSKQPMIIDDETTNTLIALRESMEDDTLDDWPRCMDIGTLQLGIDHPDVSKSNTITEKAMKIN